MSARQIVQLAGELDIPGLPSIDVSDDEITIANMPSLVFWAAMAAWGITADGLGFEDRVTGESKLVNGAADIPTALVSAAGGIAYECSTLDRAIIVDDTYDLSGSYTLAMAVAATSGSDQGFILWGSVATPVASTTYWTSVNSQSDTGRLRVTVKEIATSFLEYDGPVLTAGGPFLRVIVRVDAVTGTVDLIVNGVIEVTKTDAGISSRTAAAGLRAGYLNASGTPTPAEDGPRFRSPLVFNKSLSDAEVIVVDRMLAATQY